MVVRGAGGKVFANIAIGEMLLQVPPWALLYWFPGDWLLFAGNQEQSLPHPACELH